MAYSRREERMAHSLWLGKSTVCREKESIIGFGSSNSDSWPKPYAISSVNLTRFLALPLDAVA